MDFLSRLPKTRKGIDAIWVIVDRLTKSALLAIQDWSVYEQDDYVVQGQYSQATWSA